MLAMPFGRGALADAELDLLLLLCALEQSSKDQGRWQLAWLLTPMPEPPWAQLAHHAVGDSLRPFGTLAEPTWTAAAMAYAKDAAALAEIRRKLNDDRPSGGADRPEVAEPKAKAKAAAK